jgi:transcriptional regulator with XRE-family HTH domain
MNTDTFTAEVRAELARQRRTQRDLAAALEVDESTLGRWLTGRSDWPLSAALAAADWLGVKPSALLARAEAAA